MKMCTLDETKVLRAVVYLNIVLNKWMSVAHKAFLTFHYYYSHEYYQRNSNVVPYDKDVI